MVIGQNVKINVDGYLKDAIIESIQMKGFLPDTVCVRIDHQGGIGFRLLPVHEILLL